MTEVSFLLLGAFEIRLNNQAVDAGEPRRRAVLAALLFDAGRVVSTSTLIDRVWGDDAPTQAARTLSSYITRIRQALAPTAAGSGPVTVVCGAGGYRLTVDPGDVDVHRFRELIVQSRAAGRDDQQRVTMLREAMALVRGEPLTGIPGGWADRTRQHLSREILDGTAAWAAAELAAGNPSAVIGPLRPLAHEHPTMEHLTVVLMKALAATGRPSEALELGRAHGRRLADGFGLDQSAQIRRLYRDILCGGGPLAPAELMSLAEPLAPAGSDRSSDHLAEPVQEPPPTQAIPAAPSSAQPPPAAGAPARQLQLPRRTVLAIVAVGVAATAGFAADTRRNPAGRGNADAVHDGSIIDDFAGNALNLNEWAAGWEGLRPNESTWSVSAVRVTGGELQIVGSGRDPTGRGNVAGGTGWSPGGKDRVYGVYQIRAKFDVGSGYGAMIGLYPVDGELDSSGLLVIARSDTGSRTSVYSAAAATDGGMVVGNPLDGDFSNWATYEVEWRRDFVQFSVNGTTTLDSLHSTTPVLIPPRPMYLYIQLVPGPEGPIPAPTEDTPSKVAMHIDWVKYTP